MRRLLFFIVLSAPFGCAIVPADQPSPMKSNGGQVSTRLTLKGYPLTTMAVAPSGEIYLATDKAILKLAKDGTQTELAPLVSGVDPERVDQTKQITGVTAIELDRNGVLYVATYRYLYRVFSDGRIEHLPGVDFGKYNQSGKGSVVVRGMAFDSKGNMYLASENSDTIHKVTPEGVESVYAGLNIRYETNPMVGGAGYRNGSREQALFRSPWDIVADAQDNLYVADSGNGAIRKISPDGMVSTFFGRQESAPMPSPDPNRDRPGSIIPPTPGAALSIAKDRLGNFYLAGTDNRIRKLTPAGEVTDMAGDGTRCVYWSCIEDCSTPPPQNCYADGPGPSARFELPRGIGVDDQGVVYVVDGATELHVRVIE